MIKQLLIALMLVSGVVNAAVYKWVDSDGMAHYADEPRRGSKKVKLGETTVYSPPVFKKSSNAKAPAAEEKESTEEENKTTSESKADDAEQQAEKKEASIKYTLQMKTPNTNETVRSLDGRISFSFEATPEVPKGYKLKLSIDGRRVNQPINGMRFSLGNIPFGLHQAQGWLFDVNGEQVAKSELVTFTFRKAKIK